jgi:hypothetical protein
MGHTPNKKNEYRILMGKRERKRLLEKPRRRLEDNIKMDLRKIRCDDMSRINLDQDRDQWRAL